jgi:hypothetical protein
MTAYAVSPHGIMAAPSIHGTGIRGGFCACVRPIQPTRPREHTKRLTKHEAHD